MTIPHTISCRCSACHPPPRDNGAGLLSESYETETAYVSSRAVEFTGSSWIVYYSVKPKSIQFQSYTGWMYVSEWNKMVEKWEESS